MFDKKSNEASDEEVALAAKTSFHNFKEWRRALQLRGYDVNINQTTQELVIKKEIRL